MDRNTDADARWVRAAYGSLGLFVIAFWLAVFIIPAAKAIVEAASNPAACAGYARSDCAAVMGER
ncbi:MAG: hypothetical protein D1H97_15480 [Paracoccus sp. BP8]|nr:MAG: hypothetical protein D1H97_15480 [Paracoccus sp. BP8]